MNFTSAIIAAFLLLPGPVCPWYVHGQEALSDKDKALFDDLQVTGEAEKAARERIEKSGKPAVAPQPELPEAAAKLLDRLAVYEASLQGITDEMIGRSRKMLGGELIKLSAAVAEPGKTELIATAKNIEGLLPGVELPPASVESDFPGEWVFPGDSRWYYRDGKIKTRDFTGTWRYLNQCPGVAVADYAGSEFVDVLRVVNKPGKPASVEGVNQRGDHWGLARGKTDPGKPALPAEANKLLATARSQEAGARAKSLQEVREKRGRVAAWLVEKAKTAVPAAAKKLLDNAEKMRSDAGEPARGGGGYRRNPDTFRGRVYSDGRRRTWEFLPSGAVKSNGLSWGMWEWAKAGNDACLIICSGGSGKAENPVLVRQSDKTPGKLYFMGFEEKFEASLKQ